MKYVCETPLQQTYTGRVRRLLWSVAVGDFATGLLKRCCQRKDFKANVG